MGNKCVSATWISAWPKGKYQANVSNHDHHPNIVIIISTVPPQSPSLLPGFPFVQAFPICHPCIRLTRCKTMGIYWPLWAHAAVSSSPVLLTLNLPASWSLHPAFDSVCVPSSTTDWNLPQKKGATQVVQAVSRLGSWVGAFVKKHGLFIKAIVRQLAQH